MQNVQLYYATNRNHEGKNRWNPESYGAKFSSDGMENLRFGKVTVNVNSKEINKCLNIKTAHDKGDGERLAGYLTKCAKSAKIQAYKENLKKGLADIHQPKAKLGSSEMFKDLKKVMEKHSDVLIYIHGFNVSWFEAVGSALALQYMMNRQGIGDKKQSIMVVLFSWPSDGMALPLVSYKSDRSEAEGSGSAIGRGLLKLRDFLVNLKDKAKQGEKLCNQDIHLLCHSMGNYVLQNTLRRIEQFTPSMVLPRIFEHIFMCAPDVDDDVLESGNPMGKLHQLCRYVSIYHNRGDVAMYVSDYTKGNPERLGTVGTAHPSLLHNKIHQMNCSSLVKGIVEHSYYLWGPVNTDIRLGMDGVAFEDTVKRRRKKDSNLNNVWALY